MADCLSPWSSLTKTAPKRQFPRRFPLSEGALGCKVKVLIQAFVLVKLLRLLFGHLIFRIFLKANF